MILEILGFIVFLALIGAFWFQQWQLNLTRRALLELSLTTNRLTAEINRQAWLVESVWADHIDVMEHKHRTEQKEDLR